MTVMDTPLISANEMTKRVGCTYRQLDYWVRNGVVAPVIGADGPGTGRRFTERQVKIVRLVAGLASLGARQTVLLKAAMAAELIPECEWLGMVYVDADGDLSAGHPGRTGWAIDLAVCASPDHSPHQLVLA